MTVYDTDSSDDSPKLPADVRRALARAAEENASLIVNRLLELSAAEKEVWTTCPSCNKRHTVRVPDSSAAINAIKTLLQEGKGKEEEFQAKAPEPQPPRTLEELEAELRRELAKLELNERNGAPPEPDAA